MGQAVDDRNKISTATRQSVFELAHQIRNPLASIQGVADAFLQRGQLTTQERESMEAVRREVSKINDRLLEMLDLSQSRVSNVRQCSLNELVKNVVLVASHQVQSMNDRQGRHVTIEFIDTTKEPLLLQLDAAHIEDAVLNLVLNAIEAIEGNGRVTVRLFTCDDEALIEVTDTGCGIRPEHRIGRGSKFILALPLRHQPDLAGNAVYRRRLRAGEVKRGRPQRQTAAPLGNLIVKSMNLLGLNYSDVVSESERLARVHQNSDMRIGKSTLGNIISGSIRQPGTAKLDSLRIILNLSQADVDAAIGLQPERRFAQQLEMSRARTHEVPIDAVTRHRQVRVPILRDDANLDETQFFAGSLRRWANVEVEYLSSFFPPYLCYVVVGEEDTNAAPLAPPGSRVLVNTLLNKVLPAENVSFHERELFYVLTPHGLTCVYAENLAGEKIVLIPHPASGNLREEFHRSEVTIIGQVVGVLYPASMNFRDREQM